MGKFHTFQRGKRNQINEIAQILKVDNPRFVFESSCCCHSVCGNNLNIVSMCAVSPVVHTSNISSCQKKKKNFFSLPVAVNNSIKVGPLVFLL